MAYFLLSAVERVIDTCCYCKDIEESKNLAGNGFDTVLSTSRLMYSLIIAYNLQMLAMGSLAPSCCIGLAQQEMRMLPSKPAVYVSKVLSLKCFTAI